ncbi:hypothetical protein PPL_06577 [Heterostelium album PN500]|uniref:UNC93-like protein MFSD11 n=1 Tax=Heterostelium pallidum (strain ATCC 26659 / Pp 5 / PN500) TaxID=670386 RepID=D3BF44_HETP5|nr:hypothetical protein PPL_06577 [Heterostelium album PN500]EFA79758.1 hypothetical protein PPL_06577 [Heterostelium album PN500]|eukprot:XP_020431879.1 hypothetical protein PPL_06577 [Heterostelium album PN500]
MDFENSVNGHPKDIERQTLLGDYKVKKPLRDTNLFNVIVLGFAFCILFIAFSPTQNLETTINKNAGFISLTIIYACLSLSNFVSPLIVLKVGEKYSLIIGTLTYIAYIAANIYTNTILLYIASAVLGFGAAILWTAEGAFVIRCSTESTLGFHTGLFFALFQANQIVGNLGTAELIKAGYSDRTLFIILTITCAVSIFIFLFLGNPDNSTDDKPKEILSTKERLMLTLNLLKDRPIQLLIIALFYSGISQSFFFGDFPPLVGKNNLGYVMTVFGVCDALGSVIIGKVSDIIGRSPMIIFATLCCLGGTIFTYIIDRYISDHQLVLYFVCAGMMGFADAGYNTQLYSLLGSLYPTKGESAAAVFKFIQAIASALAFFYGPYTNLFQNVVITGSLVVPSCILFVIVDKVFNQKKTDTIQTTPNTY